jgi:hypothetical protein
MFYTLQARLQAEQVRSDQKAWMDQLPVVEAEHVSQGIFPTIDKVLEHFLTPSILEKQRCEMRRCVFYIANVVIFDHSLEVSTKITRESRDNCIHYWVLLGL